MSKNEVPIMCSLCEGEYFHEVTKFFYDKRFDEISFGLKEYKCADCSTVYTYQELKELNSKGDNKHGGRI